MSLTRDLEAAPEHDKSGYEFTSLLDPVQVDVVDSEIVAHQGEDEVRPDLQHGQAGRQFDDAEVSPTGSEDEVLEHVGALPSSPVPYGY